MHSRQGWSASAIYTEPSTQAASRQSYGCLTAHRRFTRAALARPRRAQWSGAGHGLRRPKIPRLAAGVFCPTWTLTNRLRYLSLSWV